MKQKLINPAHEENKTTLHAKIPVEHQMLTLITRLGNNSAKIYAEFLSHKRI